MTVFVLLLASFAHAQDSQFLFDPNGNLFVQTMATTAPPQIIGQPQNRIVAPSEATSFFVVAADTRALTYQWRFNGTDIGGATNEALLRQNVSTNNEGSYAVVLTNPSGSVTSAPALLMIDSDADSLADSWELAFFGNLTNNATADFDGDSLSNLQEFLDGTSPTNSASARFRLTVYSDGGGSVVLSPAQSSYTNGQTVTVTAAPFAPNFFHAWTGDVVTRSNSITLTMSTNRTVRAFFLPMDLVWTNPASGDWNVANNWSPNLVPVTNDTAIITGGATVTLNTSPDCAGVILGSANNTPTLTGSGTLTVRGNFTWISGTMSGSGRTVLEAGAALNVANPAAVVVQTRTLENGGTVLWTGAGNLALSSGAVITNRAGGLFHVQSPGGFSASGFENGRIDNAGTFRKSANAGTTATGAGVSFNNSGTAEIQTGTLSLDGGGAHTGSFAVSGGAALRLAGGTHTGNVNSSISGAGQFSVSGGTANLAGSVNVSGSNTFSSGTANVTGNYICTNNTLTISGCIATFSGTGLMSPSVVNLTSGEFGGSGTVTVNNAMNWTGGSMTGSGRTIIAVGATLNIANPALVQVQTRTLENGGTVLWTGAGNLALSSGAVITNRAGALFHVQSPAAMTLSGFDSGRIDNAGTFRKSANAGSTTTGGGTRFNNYGTVDIRSGILAANGGYVSSSSALLNCALGGTTAGTGYGQLQVAGTVTLNGTLSVDLTNGFSPALNDSFTVLTAGSRSGTFASFFYPSNIVTMQLSNTASSVILRVTNVFIAISQPILLQPEFSGPNIKLTWTATSNVTYRLESNPAVSSTNWSAIPGDVTTLSNTASKLDALTSSNRFYRVHVLP